MTYKVTFIINIEDRQDHHTNKNYFKYHHLRYSLKPIQPILLHRDGVSSTCGLFDLDHITHYLKFSIKINTNHLHRHFIKHKPYLEKVISKMILDIVN